jgi:hypothetical protein
MKLHHLFEEESQYALIMKALKTLGLSKALAKRTKLMYEDAVVATTMAIKNDVSVGYWGYVTSAANNAKIEGDLHNLNWALSSMRRVNPSELPIFKELSKEVASLDSKMEGIRDLLKGMDASWLVVQEIAKIAKDEKAESFNRTMARATLKKLGIAEKLGVTE